MDRLGDQLLAGSRLAGDEDRRVADRHLFHLLQQRLQPLRGADDIVEAELSDQLFPQLAVLLQEPGVLQGVLHPVEQLLGLERLGQHVVGPLAERLDRHLHRRIGGDHDHRDRRVLGLDLLQHLKAVHPRHLDVGHHQVPLPGSELLHRRERPRIGLHGKAVVLQDRLHHPAEPFLVVDQHDFLFVRHFCSLVISKR